jgi:hypothetical protein
VSAGKPLRLFLVLPAGFLLLVGGAAVPQSAQGGQQPSQPLEEIAAHFAEKEQEYARAHALYRYELSVKIQEIGEDNEVVGTFEQVSDVDFDPGGRRRFRLQGNPRTDLRYLGITRVELTDLEFVPLFILAPEEIPSYEISYLSRERVDEVNTYVFRLAPRGVPRPTDRIFEGIVYVDADKLDIVRAFGRTLPVQNRGAFNGYFRRLEIFREPVDDFLFPTYIRADDVISAGQKPVRARLILRFSKHEKVRDSAPAPER